MGWVCTTEMREHVSAQYAISPPVFVHVKRRDRRRDGVRPRHSDVGGTRCCPPRCPAVTRFGEVLQILGSTCGATTECSATKPWIVESPAKAATIEGHLGPDYHVNRFHRPVQTSPAASELPKDMKKAIPAASLSTWTRASSRTTW